VILVILFEATGLSITILIQHKHSLVTFTKILQILFFKKTVGKYKFGQWQLLNTCSRLILLFHLCHLQKFVFFV